MYQDINDINVQEYINSLPDNTLSICIANWCLTFIPDLSRFVKLRRLDCSQNKLTSLSNLPDNLSGLFCSRNNLNVLPNLPNSLEVLDCSNNQLTSLPDLPGKLTNLS